MGPVELEIPLFDGGQAHKDILKNITAVGSARRRNNKIPAGLQANLLFPAILLENALQPVGRFAVSITTGSRPCRAGRSHVEGSAADGAYAAIGVGPERGHDDGTEDDGRHDAVVTLGSF